MTCTKKLLVLIAAACINIASYTDAYAQTSAVEALLAAIKDDTGRILNKIENLPDYFQEIGYYLINLTDSDTSNHAANLQEKFTELGILFNDNVQQQNALQYVPASPGKSAEGLNVDLLGPNASPSTIWYANDILYSTILGRRFFDPDPRERGGQIVRPEYNYIKNASGINLRHLRPGINWQGTRDNQIKYQNYYNTLMAAESFGGYVLANQYVDGNKFNSKQKELIDLASSGTFFTEVGAQPIGRVLRELLMFQSQMFVLMTQMIQYQKQLVTAQVMTNSLIIAGFQTSETILSANAQGIRPQV